MSDVVLIDTSILVELLDVPGRCGNLEKDEARSLFDEGGRERWIFMLPLVTVLETGNHIGQVNNGHHRREAADRLRQAVSKAIDREAPWVLSTPIDSERLAKIIQQFPDWAGAYQSGFGDLSLVEEWERLCRVFPTRRVWIWSLDRHLQSYDRKIAR